jgi:hypothetical protein
MRALSDFGSLPPDHVGRSSAALRTAAALLLMSPLWSPAANLPNARSPLGINLEAVTYYSTEFPFMNNFLTASEWITHSDTTWDTHEEQYANLDANGWPITLSSLKETARQQYNSLGVLLFVEGFNTADGYYPGGRYIVLYDGQGTLTYGADATLVSRSPGRDVINVVPSKNGVDLRITVTDPKHTGDYIRNVRLVSVDNEAAIKGGQIFNPKFLQLIQPFRALRFMDWFQTNGSAIRSWSDRPLPTHAFFGTRKGVPIEIAVQAANAISADAWLNVPAMADDHYITQMATLVHRMLGSTQKVYVEYSNEVWNASFSQYNYALSQGKAIWPTPTLAQALAHMLGLSRQGSGDYEWNRNFYGMRTAQICDLWKAVWGEDKARVICVLGAQAAWSFSATESLKCPYWTQGAPCSDHGISAIAIAPYMGGQVPSAWTAHPDGGLSDLFSSIYLQNDPSIPPGGFLAQDADWERDYARNVLATYKLPLIAYEGGQTFSDGATPALNHLYIAANVDPRMADAYTKYFRQWKQLGGELFVYYNDVGVARDYGSWGAIQSLMQKTVPLSSAPPKWQAIQNFISSTPCWWANCALTAER